MKNEKKIKPILGRIRDELMHDTNDFSLLTGSSGFCLFELLYTKHFLGDQLDDDFSQSLQAILDNYDQLKSNTFSGGKAGVNWFFHYLGKLGYVDSVELEELFTDDSKLEVSALQMLSIGNFDFLHGALGIAHYLIDKKNRNPEFFKQIFDGLNLLMPTRDSMICHWDFVSNQSSKGIVNVGFAHGLGSILKFCLECLSLKIFEQNAKEMSCKISQYLLDNLNYDKSKSYFGNWTGIGSPESEFSRLGWCYGDLCNAYVLFQAGKILEDSYLIDTSLEIFNHTFKRRTFIQTNVQDAGLCHGSAGIAHIYNKMWNETRDPNFKKSCDYWISRTIHYSKYEDSISGYKKYSTHFQKLQNEPGLLEGSSGIGLVLISYLTNDFSWDYCLMLNKV